MNHLKNIKIIGNAYTPSSPPLTTKEKKKGNHEFEGD